MNIDHSICAYQNKDYGEWKRKEAKFPYSLFFYYVELEINESRYPRRYNKLDRLFDWICKRLEQMRNLKNKI